jgi:hypothetical protein
MMYACHSAANFTANVHLCQERFTLSLLPYIAITRLAETKRGFDSHRPLHFEIGHPPKSLVTSPASRWMSVGNDHYAQASAKYPAGILQAFCKTALVAYDAV